MGFDAVWFLIGLPLVFAAGWFASRFDLRQLRLDNRRTPKAYFRGLTHLLNEQQDQAIDAFIEAVQSDPDTLELHFALGGLFRRRGDYNRAVRVHEHLLARADLPQADRHRAQHALAMDFLKAGLLDRAEDALHKLVGTAYALQAELALLGIYERSRDWPKATQIAERLNLQSVQTASTSSASAPRTVQLELGSFTVRMAHYLCEQAVAAGDSAGAVAHLNAARALAPTMARPLLDLSKWHEGQGETSAALACLMDLVSCAPAAVPLAAVALARLALLGDANGQTGAVPAARTALLNHYKNSPCLDVMQALVLLDDGNPNARDAYVRHLDHVPSLIAATRWMAHERLEHEQFHPQVQRALDRAVKPLARYRCAACGFEAERHFWQCAGCQAWDTYPARRVEEL